MQKICCRFVNKMWFFSGLQQPTIFVFESDLSLIRSYKFFQKLSYSHLPTLKSLIEEHACLDFSGFLSTLLSIFHVINEKFHPARLLTYLVKKQAGWNFFPTLLVYSGLLFNLLGTSKYVSTQPFKICAQRLLELFMCFSFIRKGRHL